MPSWLWLLQERSHPCAYFLEYLSKRGFLEKIAALNLKISFSLFFFLLFLRGEYLGDPSNYCTFVTRAYAHACPCICVFVRKRALESDPDCCLSMSESIRLLQQKEMEIRREKDEE